MEIEPRTPFGFAPHAGSPEIAAGKEAIRLAISRVSFEAGTVELDVSASFLFPDAIASRYRDVEESMVLVVHDIEQADGGALLARNTFIEFPPGERDGPNQLAEPPLPMPGRGSLASEGYQGAWLNVTVAFPCAVAVPRYRPSVYVYLILENYVSNVIGIDLVDKKSIEF